MMGDGEHDGEGETVQLEWLRRQTVKEGKNKTTSLRHKSRSYIHSSRIRQDP